jgi:hypothetical protein
MLGKPRRLALARESTGLLSTMATFKFAVYANGGLIVTIVSPAFGKLVESDQRMKMARLQICAEAAGLSGTVIPVWKNEDTYEFLTPPECGDFLTNLQWTEILGRIQGEFSCD